MKACIRAIEYFLPDDILTNRDLATEFPDWSVEKIGGKTGIDTRHIAGEGECASDLAVRAAQKLFDSAPVVLSRSTTSCSARRVRITFCPPRHA